MNDAFRVLRRHMAWVALGVVLASPTAIEAQPATVHRIGVLTAPIPSIETGLRDGLRELGYVEARSVVIEWRRSTGTESELRALASDLARAGVELIVAPGTPAAQAALRATRLPVVFVSGDAVATGLVASLANPGGRATGISGASTELTSKRLELLQQVLPREVRRVVYLQNSSNPTAPTLLEEAKAGARALMVHLEPVDARNARELDTAIRAIERSRADGVLIAADLLFLSHKATIARALREARMPAIFPWREYHDDGVLMSYSLSIRWIMRRVAEYADKILKGAKPADLPVEQVSQYELIIDLRVARELKLNIPPELLLRATEVMQ